MFSFVLLQILGKSEYALQCIYKYVITSYKGFVIINIYIQLILAICGGKVHNGEPWNLCEALSQ